MPTEGAGIVGAGGHAGVVLDALRLARPGLAIRLFDEQPEKVGTVRHGLRVERLPSELSELGALAMHVAVGNDRARRRIAERLATAGLPLLSVVHPTAACSPACQLGAGSFVAATAVVGPGARVGRAVIVNHGAIVDHDCVVGDGSHIAPGAVLGGCVIVGDECLIGARSTILPGRSVGDGAIVGAGAVVTHDVPRDTKVAGIPARPFPT